MASAPQAPPASQPSGRAKSCTECRQVKLACDAKLNFPSPCSRCATRKLECKLDATFKRIPTRKRIEQFTAEIHSLRAAVNNAQSSARLSEGSIDQSVSRPTPSISTSAVDEPQSTSGIQWLNLTSDETQQPRTLGEAALSPETIHELLSHFNLYYFPHLPILEPINSVSALVESSELLFWTIMLISSQWHPDLSYLYYELITPHENLMGSIVQNSIQSIEVIQSLLLLCFWPVPRVNQSSDPAWIYIGIAINAAMRLGLREPLTESSSFRDISGWSRNTLSHLSLRTKVLTWLSCFNINVQVSMFVGLPAHICSANQLDQIAATCRNAQHLVPRDFLAFTEIQRQIGRYHSTLDGISVIETHNSLASLFESELDNIKPCFQDCWSAELEVDLQSAKLYLYALSFTSEQRLRSEDSSNGPMLSTFTQMAFQKGLHSAAQLISTVAMLQKKTDSLPTTILNSAHTISESSHLFFYPKTFFTNLYFAAVFQLRYLAVQKTANSGDRGIAINSTTTAYEIFKIFGSSRDHKRAAVMIEILGRMTRSGGHPVDLSIKDRLGASIHYDSSLACAMFRNRDRQTDGSGSSGPWLKLGDVADLPPTPQQLVTYTKSALRHPQSAMSSTDSSSLDVDMQMEQGWSWGFWDNALFDSLGMNSFLETDLASMPPKM